jgi:serine/threonine protein kinase
VGGGGGDQVNVYGRQLSEEDKQRLVREVQILKSLNNPHIIKCYGAWRDESEEMNFVTELFTR